MISPSSTHSAKHTQGYILHQKQQWMRTSDSNFTKRPHRRQTAFALLQLDSGPHAIYASLGYPSSQPKRHIDRISRRPAGDRIVSLYFTTVRDMSLRIARLPLGDPNRNPCFLGSSDSTTLTASRSVQSFSHGLRRYATDRTAYTQTTLDL